MKLYKYYFRKSFGKGFWISPNGNAVQLSFSEKHIEQVISHHGIFGMIKSEIEEIYAKHHEQLGEEGNAREEIILNLVKKGWIRIRKYDKPDLWSINTPSLNSKIKDVLHSWTKAVLEVGIGHKFDDVRIDTPDFVQILSLEQIVQHVFSDEEKIIFYSRLNCYDENITL